MKSNDLVNFIRRAMEPLKTRVQLMVGRAVLLASNDGTTIQTWQIKALNGETFDGVPRVQEFGFASNPPKDTDGIIVSVGGSRESMVIIATDHKKLRFKNLTNGESAIYTDDGTHIHLKKDGQVEIKTATKVTIDTADVEITGNLKVVGTSNLVGKVTADDEIEAAKDIKSAMNVIAGFNVQATALVQAAGYAGPAGGAPGGAMVTNVPIQSTAAIETTADVIGGGTTMAALKGAANTHKHTGVSTGSGTSGPTDSPL